MSTGYHLTSSTIPATSTRRLFNGYSSNNNKINNNKRYNSGLHHNQQSPLQWTSPSGS